MKSNKSKYSKVPPDLRGEIYRAKMDGKSYRAIAKQVLNAEGRHRLVKTIVDVISSHIKSIHDLFTNGTLQPPTEIEIVNKFPAIFYSKPDFKQYLKKNGNHIKRYGISLEDHMKRYGITLEEMEEIRELKKRKDTIIQSYRRKMANQATFDADNSRVPELNNYPAILSANNDLGDFERPELAPGEISPLRLKGSEQIFNENMAEIGLPDVFVDMVKLLIVKEGIYEKLPMFLGKHQRSFDYYPREIMMEGLIPNWSFLRCNTENGAHSDLMLVRPSNQKKFDELVGCLIGAGLEQILSNLPKFLGLQADDSGTVNVVFTEVNFLGVSINEPEDDTSVLTRDDAHGVNGMCKIMFPVNLPVSEKPPLFVVADSVRKGYTHRKEAALAIKAGELHGNNMFGRTNSNSHHLVLSIHIRQRNDELDGHLASKTFKMPVARRGGGDNINTQQQPLQQSTATAIDARPACSQKQQQQTPPPPPQQQQQQPLIQQPPFPILVPSILIVPFPPFCVPGMPVFAAPYPPAGGFLSLLPPLPVVQRDDRGDNQDEEAEETTLGTDSTTNAATVTPGPPRAQPTKATPAAAGAEASVTEATVFTDQMSKDVVDFPDPRDPSSSNSNNYNNRGNMVLEVECLPNPKLPFCTAVATTNTATPGPPPGHATDTAAITNQATIGPSILNPPDPRNLIGKRIAKDFKENGGVCYGTVRSYEPPTGKERGFWDVLYDDGDNEGYNSDQISPLLAFYDKVKSGETINSQPIVDSYPVQHASMTLDLVRNDAYRWAIKSAVQFSLAAELGKDMVPIIEIGYGGDICLLKMVVDACNQFDTGKKKPSRTSIHGVESNKDVHRLALKVRNDMGLQDKLDLQHRENGSYGYVPEKIAKVLIHEIFGRFVSNEAIFAIMKDLTSRKPGKVVVDGDTVSVPTWASTSWCPVVQNRAPKRPDPELPVICRNPGDHGLTKVEEIVGVFETYDFSSLDPTWAERHETQVHDKNFQLQVKENTRFAGLLCYIELGFLDHMIKLDSRKSSGTRRSGRTSTTERVLKSQGYNRATNWSPVWVPIKGGWAEKTHFVNLEVRCFVTHKTSTGLPKYVASVWETIGADGEAEPRLLGTTTFTPDHLDAEARFGKDE